MGRLTTPLSLTKVMLQFREQKGKNVLKFGNIVHTLPVVLCVVLLCVIKIIVSA